MDLAAALLDLLFPPKCPFCQALLAHPRDSLCAQCQRTLPWLTGAEAEQKLEWISVCASPLRYKGLVRDSIRRYKFSGLSCYAKNYGVLCARCAQDHLAGRYDLISWVPVSRRRLRQRGYDQAMLLSRETAAQLQSSALPLLRKAMDNPPQSGTQDDAQRRANVLGVYEVTRPELVRGRRILLLDDVVTTGSTLSEAARTLKSAGAEEVLALTVARAR